MLALKDTNKRSINSDWKIELPGEYQIAGTTVRYVRRGLWEKISAKGPTKIPLHLMVTCCALAFVLVLRLQGSCQFPSSLGALGRGAHLVPSGLPGHLLLKPVSLSLSLFVFSYLIPSLILMPENFPFPILRPGYSLAELPSFSKGTASRKEMLGHVTAGETWLPGADSPTQSLCFYIRWHRSAPRFVGPHWKLPFGNELLTPFPNQCHSDFPDSSLHQAFGNQERENQVSQDDGLPG